MVRRGEPIAPDASREVTTCWYYNTPFFDARTRRTGGVSEARQQKCQILESVAFMKL
jgi:hypothetical protein